MNEDELLKRLKLRDKKAFEVLLSLYRNRVINTCFKFLLDKEDAEDVSQEVFIEVYESINSFRGESKLSTWIYRIAISKSLDELKKRSRKKRISSIGKLLHLDDFAHWITGGEKPDQKLQEKERMSSILNALNTLPSNQRIAFTLSKIEGYTNSEIAEIMGITLMAVESLISRAKKKATNELMIILKNN